MTMEGHITKTVAWRLGISVRTVETHRTKILRKLSARNFLEVSRYFREHNDFDRLARNTSRNAGLIHATVTVKDERQNKSLDLFPRCHFPRGEWLPVLADDFEFAVSFQGVDGLGADILF